MIEDLEGATSEASRRMHVAVLSAATAAFAIVLFYVLVAPPIFEGAPQADSPSPSPSFVMTVASNWLQRLPLDPTTGICDGRARGEFQFGVPATGAWLASVVYDRTGRFPVAFVREERGTGRLVLTCMSPDSFTPRIDRAR